MIMKFIRYISYLLYSYYSRGPRRNVAYLSAILGITFLIYIQLMIVTVVLSIDEYIPMSLNESKGTRYLKLMLYLSPIFFILYFGVQEKKLEALKEKYGNEYFDKEVVHRTILFSYFILSFVVLMILAILRKS